METTTEIEQAILTQRRKKKKKWLLLLAALVAVLAIAVCLWRMAQPQSKYEIDRNALAGFLSGHTAEEIEAELNRIIDEGRFAVSVNPTPVVSAGQVNLMLENVPANHYAMQVDVYLTQANGAERLLYRSGLIQPGFYIESMETEFAPAAGEYNGRAVFKALLPDGTNEEIGQTEATLLIFVEGAA